MRKRRRLANKMTIMVCAVLIAVSAFFYAPMEVSAEEVGGTFIASVDEEITQEELAELDSSLSGSFDAPIGSVARYVGYVSQNLGSFTLADNLNPNALYEVEIALDFMLDFSSDLAVACRNIYFSYDYLLMYNNTYVPYADLRAGKSVTKTFYLDGSQLMSSKNLNTKFSIAHSSDIDVSVSYDVDLYIKSISEVSNSDATDYQNGYSAGYADGESVGYGNGYSNGFAEGEASVDTDAIYDEAFQAGKDSVDTESYYDAGYEAGYQAAYSIGYDNGYDSGYDDAMSKVAQWGADTTEYPKLLTTKTMAKWGNPSEVQVGVVTDVNASLSVDSGIDVNHNHTYRFDISVTDYDVTGSSYIDPPVNHDLYFYVGSNEFYLISQNRTSCNQTLYVNGSTMSDVFGFIGKAYNVHVLDTQTTDQLVYTYLGYTVKIYDMGPTGDTQNHIANQTDKLNENADKNTDKILNSWDSSKGDKVQSDLDTGLNEYQTAEDSLFATATTGMKDFTFFDFESVPAMITGLSFVTSIMTRWFEAAGGASGVGIVLSVLFSVMLVSMVLGLYRMYQSAGHRSEVKQRRESRKKGK